MYLRFDRFFCYSCSPVKNKTSGVQRTLQFLLFSCQKQNTRRSIDSPVSLVLLSKTQHQAFSGLSCFSCSPVKNKTPGVQWTLLFLLFSCQKQNIRRSVDPPVSPVLLSKTKRQAFSGLSSFSCSPVKNKTSGVQRTLLFSCQNMNYV